MRFSVTTVRSKRAVVAASGTALLLMLTGCTPPTPPSSDGLLSIVVASYPLEFLAERIAGPIAEVTNLTSPGAEPHDLELTAQQLSQIAEADLVVYQKGFQPAVDEAIAAVAPRAVVDVASGVALQPGEGQNPEGDHNESLDPHIWLDPSLMVTMATNISTALTEVAPTERDAISAATTDLTEELSALDAEFVAGLRTCERREFVTSHAAFGYLARRYDLTQIPIAGLDPTSEPTAARIKEVQDLVRAHQVTTIFYETLVSDAVAQALATDLGLRTDVLDPLEGITGTSRGTDYLEVMRSNLEALATANECR